MASSFLLPSYAVRTTSHRERRRFSFVAQSTMLGQQTIFVNNCYFTPLVLATSSPFIPPTTRDRRNGGNKTTHQLSTHIISGLTMYTLYPSKQAHPSLAARPDSTQHLIQTRAAVPKRISADPKQTGPKQVNRVKFKVHTAKRRLNSAGRPPARLAK